MKVALLVAVALLGGSVIASPTALRSVLPKEDFEDAKLSVIGLLTKYGYPSETHKVQTGDGYILTLHRIPYGKKCGADQPRKPPVLVQHGLLCSSADWILAGPEKGLGYILADHCYDVWLGNSRGNTESKEHASLDVASPEFWDFSWNEMGEYDLPAVIDYITQTTEQPSIHYVGHSQGTTQFFIFASQHPDYAPKVRSMHALAPVAYMNHLTSPFAQILARFEAPLEWIADVIGMDEFLPKSEFIAEVGGALCVDQHPNLQAMCSNVLFILCGFDSEQLNTTLLPIITGHTPAGAATKQLLHYAQEIKSGHFRKYDYGFLGNQKHYGSGHPPDYDMSKVNIPIALHYSSNDWMAAVTDVERLAGELQHSLIGQFKVPLEKFNHLDYMWAIDVNELLYNKVISLMDRY